MNELHLKVLLFFFLHNDLLSFSPEHLSFQSNTFTELKTQNNALKLHEEDTDFSSIL